MTNVVHKPHPHDSGPLHVTGTAPYVDDLPTPANALHACFGLSPVGHAAIEALDLSAVWAAPGVVDVVTAADIPGENNAGPVVHDEPLLADGTILFPGQALFCVFAETRVQARKAARLFELQSTDLPAIATVDDAVEANSFLHDPLVFKRGDVNQAIEDADHSSTSRLYIGGQEHFYLEGQGSLALPSADGLHIISSTQHPSEIQDLTAEALGISAAEVTVEVRRMGGAFGGKETQAAPLSIIAALGARRTGRAVRFRLDRDDDFILTGKRHDFRADIRVGFDQTGLIKGVDGILASRCGYGHDLSRAINDRAMFHADNAYFYPALELTSLRAKTHTVSNTAFRGFGGPQGMMLAERLVDKVAAAVHRDPLDVRLANLYDEADRAITPYGMTIEDNVLPQLMPQLAESSEYRARRAAIIEANASAGRSPVRRGIALTPVRFGISFTTSFLNQAGALINIYKDGSILLNHGGTEMGQGLFVKVAQVAAEVFGVRLEDVKISATRTDKVPNTSATAASSGSDLNGWAAKLAAVELRDRLSAFWRAEKNLDGGLTFADGHVTSDDGQSWPFADVVRAAYMGRVSLSATGYYRTPKIDWDAKTGQGRPFLYFAYGAAVSEVEIDTLTGANRVVRADILHDVGRSLNPDIDHGQIEGGYVQGMGWLTMEELVYSARGEVLTHAPSTYKIPCASDRPDVLNIDLFENENTEDTIFKSKAVGEPPLMLAISAHSALAHAVSSFSPSGRWPDLDAPATAEEILRTIAAERVHSL
jgi:xanthine dehydrogenase large subunit